MDIFIPELWEEKIRENMKTSEFILKNSKLHNTEYKPTLKIKIKSAYKKCSTKLIYGIVKLLRIEYELYDLISEKNDYYEY